MLSSKETVMFVQVATYEVGTGSIKELQIRVAKGPPKVMATVPGFVDYYAFDAGDGVVASVTIFDDETGLRKAEEKLAGWVSETVDIFQITPQSLSEGAAFATKGLP